MSYVKLSAEILDSTVWREAGHVRLVWIAMLAMKNEYQEVMASVPGLADRARVTRAECDDALAVLSSPDLDSRSQVEEGRRILQIPGGWFIVNGETYRKRESPDERRDRKAAYMREHRAAKSSPGTGSVPSVPSVPNVDAVTDHKRHVDNVDRVPSVDHVTANVDRVTPRSESGPAEAEQSQSKVRDQILVEFALDGGDLVGTASAASPTATAQVRRVFEAWKASTGHAQAKLDAKRTSRIAARLRDGFTVEQLLEVLKNWRNDPHLAGKSGTIYDGIQTLFRDVEQVERLIRLTSAARPANGSAPETNAVIYDPGY